MSVRQNAARLALKEIIRKNVEIVLAYKIPNSANGVIPPGNVELLKPVGGCDSDRIFDFRKPFFDDLPQQTVGPIRSIDLVSLPLVDHNLVKTSVIPVKGIHRQLIADP